MQITREGFQESLKDYLKENDISISDLARRIGKSDRTVGDWIRLGIKLDSRRQEIITEYPWLFTKEISATESPMLPMEKSVSSFDHKVLVLIKTEQAMSTVLYLMANLQWFLFEASAEDRNSFRDSMGDDWKNFLELTRAMTGEMAFEVTRQEGRLDWCKNQ